MRKDEMLQILEKNKSLIESNNFKKFYGNIYGYNRKYFTDLFLKSGINPLDYMEEIPDYYASGLDSLKYIIIPNNIKNIGGYAFFYCGSLTNIEIPDNVIAIGDFAFYFCSHLTNVIFEENSQLKSISKGAFIGCINLTSVTIPNSVKIIGEDAFAGCTKLEDIYYEGSQEDWKKIGIERGNNYLQSATIHYNSKI